MFFRVSAECLVCANALVFCYLETPVWYRPSQPRSRSYHHCLGLETANELAKTERKGRIACGGWRRWRDRIATSRGTTYQWFRQGQTTFARRSSVIAARATRFLKARLTWAMVGRDAGRTNSFDPELGRNRTYSPGRCGRGGMCGRRDGQVRGACGGGLMGRLRIVPSFSTEGRPYRCPMLTARRNTVKTRKKAAVASFTGATCFSASPAMARDCTPV